MKLTCDIVQDLLPLYEDGVCSEGSRAAVEAHLKECAACRGEQAAAGKLPERELVMDIPVEEKKVIGSFKKVRRRWMLSLIAVLLVVPVLWLSVNQARGAGVCFTNLDDIWTARRYVRALAEGDFEKTADMMDYAVLYEAVLDVQNIGADQFMENTERVQIGEQVWYMDRVLADEIDREADAMDIWSDLILNKQNWGVMLPEEMVREVLTREGIPEGHIADMYSSLDTPWGTYLTSDERYQGYSQSGRENVDYALHFSMLPEDMYLDIQDDIEAYAQQMVANNAALYESAWNMTGEEFTTFMREKYIRELEGAFAQGIQITDAKFYNAYRLGSERWTVDLLIGVTKDGQQQEMHIRPDTGDGLISFVGWSYTQGAAWQEMLTDALNLVYYD